MSIEQEARIASRDDWCMNGLEPAQAASAKNEIVKP